MDLVERIVNGFAGSAFDVMGALAPYGAAMAGGLVALSILFMGLAWMNGLTSLMAGSIGTLGVSTVTYYALANWQAVTQASLDTATWALQAMGIDRGVYGLFSLAYQTASRIMQELVGFSWSSPISSSLMTVMAPISALAILVTMSIPALLAVGARIELMIGAALAPLVLPFVIFGPVRSLGFVAITWQVSATLRVIALGLVSRIIADQVAGVIAVPGTDGVMTLGLVLQLVIVGVLSVLFALQASGLARAIVHGTPGALGWTAISSTGGMVMAGAGVAAKGAMAAGSSVAGRLGGGGGGSGGAGGGAAGSVQRASGTGSAFARTGS